MKLEEIAYSSNFKCCTSSKKKFIVNLVTKSGFRLFMITSVLPYCVGEKSKQNIYISHLPKNESFFLSFLYKWRVQMYGISQIFNLSLVNRKPVRFVVTILSESRSNTWIYIFFTLSVLVPNRLRLGSMRNVC